MNDSSTSFACVYALSQVLPLVQLSDPDAFDHSTFWAPLIAEARATARTLASIEAPGGGDSAGDQAWDDAQALLDETEDIEASVYGSCFSFTVMQVFYPEWSQRVGQWLSFMLHNMRVLMLADATGL